MANFTLNPQLNVAQLVPYKIAPDSYIRFNANDHCELVKGMKKYLEQIKETDIRMFNMDEFEQLCDQLSYKYKCLMDLSNGNPYVHLHKPKTVPILSSIDKNDLIKYNLFGDVGKQFEKDALDVLIRNWENSIFREYCQMFYENGTKGSMWLYTKYEPIPENVIQISNEWDKINNQRYNLSLLFVTGPEKLYNYDISDNSLLFCALISEINDIISKINFNISMVKNHAERTASFNKMQKELDSYPDIKSYLEAHEYNLECIYVDKINGTYLNAVIDILNGIDGGKEWLLNDYTNVYDNHEILDKISAHPSSSCHSGTSFAWTLNNVKSYFKKGSESFARDCLTYQKFNIH